jgi:aryl-phospho-beta-D-glucosidase BglC (GH1 family)
MNTKHFYLLTLALLIIGHTATAQITPAEAVAKMTRGINIGNTNDAPWEGTWGNPPVKERAFADYKNAGFNAIRIPITWDKHVLTSSPYTVNKAWMDSVENMVDWGLAQGLFIIINAHHDSWIKCSTCYTSTNIARFDSIWSQLAVRMKDKSDHLLFEIINEPQPLSLANTNSLNIKTLKTIRKTNPTRLVLYSGDKWSGPSELPAATIPDVNDKYLIGYYHSYDPYPFGLEGTGSYGSDATINATKLQFDNIATWSTQKNIPVVLGEFGAQKKCEYNSRMTCYATVVEQALVHGVAPFAWDDGGDFAIYNRNTGEFNEIKDILIHTYKESPNKLSISLFNDTLISLKWTNRTTLNDSIIVERKTGASAFSAFAKIAPDATSFNDSTTVPGKAYYYRLKANIKDSIEIQSYPVMINVLPVSRKPYLGIVAQIPGTVEAENFDTGGEGLTYHDTDPTNHDLAYRPNDGVDLGEHATGKYHVGYTDNGEWLEYTVNVKESNTYKAAVSYAAGAGAGAQITIKAGANSASLTVKGTASWTTYADTSTLIKLTAGEQIMRITIVKSGIDIDKVTFTLNPTTSLVDNTNNALIAYPNPTTNQLSISGLKEKAIVSIYNVQGILVKSIAVDNANKTLYINELTDGVYFLNVIGKTQNLTQKIIKKN